MLTNEEARALRAGDVVAIRPADYPEVCITGPLRRGVWQALMVGSQVVVFRDGDPAPVHLTVLERAHQEAS